MQTKAINKEERIFGTFTDKVKDFSLLVKFKLNLTVVFSSVMAYLIALGSSVHWIGILILAVGGFLVTGAANALNQVLERDYDKLMKRTANRPLATGRMNVSDAVLIAGLMCLLGTFLLSMLNAWTGLLGMLSLVLYSFVYTPMKRMGNTAVAIGAIPGALPAMIGCVAAQGTISTLAVVLFAIQFFWQFPHFWAIAWIGDEDYKKAGFNLLPNATGQLDKSVGGQSLIFALFLVPISVMPFYLGVCGWISAIILVFAAFIYAFCGWKLAKECTRTAALRLMFCSFFYLPIILFALYLDKI